MTTRQWSSEVPCVPARLCKSTQPHVPCSSEGSRVTGTLGALPGLGQHFRASLRSLPERR